MSKIYGVDLEKNITPVNVREAIIECFFQAHGEIEKKNLKELQADFGESGMARLTRAHTERIIRKSFKETGGNFERPSKKEIIACMDWLAEYSKNFRAPEIIKKHYSQIMKLVDRLG